MERISIFNYEAFYLDYLEGNLSEEDTQMLMQFLEEHPECRLEEEEFVSLENDETLVFAGKQSLKQVDESGAIAMDNVEHFMIAEAEGILPEEKVAELNTFVDENPELAQTRKRYGAVYFEPETIVYSGKSDLKQRRAIVLWPYVSGAAAAAVVALVMLTNIGQVKLDQINYAFELPVEVSDFSFTGSQTNDTKEPQKPQKVQETPTKTETYSLSGQRPIVAKANTRISDVVQGAPLKHRTDALPTRFDDLELQAVNQYDPKEVEATPTPPTPKPDDMAWHNPIKPVTDFISKKTNTKVDYQQSKPDQKKKGFQLKIGKFEVSRKKH